MYEHYYSTCQEMCRGLGTVRECQRGERRAEKERERERDKAKEKERGGRRETWRERQRRESEGDGNEERRGGLGRAERRSFLTRRDRSTVNHSLIPPSLCPLPLSLHMNGGYVILIKRSRVTVEPSVWTGHSEARGVWNIPHNTNLSSPLPRTWLATVGVWV